MQEDKPLEGLKDSLININPLVGVALTVGVAGMIMGVMDKMIGDTEKIPKGVVKELMEGVVSGIVEHFDTKVEGLEYDKEQLQKQLDQANDEKNELEDENNKLEEQLVAARSANVAFANKLKDEAIQKNLADEKDKILKKKK